MGESLKMESLKMLVRFFSAALLLCTTPALLAQSYPAKPIRWIVPFAAGSSTDISGRFFGQQLSVMVGQPVVIENRPGADGAIGIVAAKNAPADGYTQVVAGWTNLTVNPVVMKDLQYDPVKDFKPITGFTRSMLGIAVSPSTNIRTVAELAAAAKADPVKFRLDMIAGSTEDDAFRKSRSLAVIKAAAERHPGMGLLHFDAHHDLREAYEARRRFETITERAFYLTCAAAVLAVILTY